MSGLVKSAAQQIVPWRGADWRVVVAEGAVLILAGVYLLADGERAGFILGLIVGAALLIDGIRQWLLGFRRLARGRIRDFTVTRGAVGVVTGGLVLVLSILQQITVFGIRIAIGAGGLAYGVLGLALTVPAIRSRRLSWTAATFDVLLVLVAVLLLYRVATSDSIAGLLTITAWLVIGSGIAVGLLGVTRLLTGRRPTVSTSGDTPST